MRGEIVVICNLCPTQIVEEQEKLKAEVFQWILQHFDDNPDLKKNPWHRLDNGDNTTELPQDVIPPPNPVHKPFRYEPQPAPQPSMSRNEHILDFPPPGILHLSLTLHIFHTLTLHHADSAQIRGGP
ncbi:hypothetical protein EDB19DRAFT_1830153 [Suillus lakei]|nr:hypothetical protein EDB19DRAFT_1830153 [Suillus lakei]